MKRWLTGLLAGMFACNVHAQDVPTQVTLAVADGALHARYALHAPVARFELGAYDTPQRGDTWRPLDDAWTFDGATVARKDGAAFSEVALQLHPDIRFVDRHYRAVERVGSDGWLVYLNALNARDGVTTVHFELPQAYVLRFDGQTHSAPLPQAVAGAQSRVYFGPERHVSAGAMTLIAGEEIPPWLRTLIMDEANKVVSALTERLGSTLPAAPTLTLTYTAEWPGAGYQADTLDGLDMVLALRGMRLEEDDTNFIDTLRNTVAHEIVHFWNGDLWESTRNAAEPWLHEGAAEYLASRVWQDEAMLRAEAEARIRACLERENRRPFDGSQGPVQGQAPYHCGFVMQLLAEAASLRNAQGDIFALWRAVFASAEDGRYSPEAFVREATRRGGEDFAAAARMVLGDFTGVDVATLAAAFTAAGLAVRVEESAPGRQAIVLEALPAFAP